MKQKNKIKIYFIEILQVQTLFCWVLLSENLSRKKSRRYQILKTKLWTKHNSKEKIMNQ